MPKYFFVVVYVTISWGDAGGGGLQTGGNPADTPGAIAVASVDSIDASQNFGILSVSNKIFFQVQVAFGKWQLSFVHTIHIMSDFLK